MELIFAQIHVWMVLTRMSQAINAFLVILIVLHAQVMQNSACRVGLQTLELLYFWMAISVFNSVD